jgi:putative ABC transport system permease protein
MIKNTLLIAFRSMKKNKAFIFINVFGMGIAIACTIVGYLAYQYDATFDAVHDNGQSIYRVSSVRSFEGDLTHYGYVPLPLGTIAANSLGDVTGSSRFSQSQSNFKREADLFPSNLSYVDPEFFQMFTFEFIAGNPKSLSDNASALISESMAIKLFGTTSDIIEKTITQVYRNELKEIKISGVFRDPPRNSSFFNPDGSAFMNFENYKDEFKDVRDDDWAKETTLFLSIEDATRVGGVYRQLQPYIAANNKVRLDFQIQEFKLIQFASMAKEDRTTDARVRTNPAPPKSAIIGTITMGLPILLIACFNLTNTAIAISSRRLKEIGIRKVMGSKRKQLIAQFIGETTCICFLALIVGVILTDLFVAGWNIATANNIHLTMSYLNNAGFVAFLFAVLLFTGILAGSYPAFYITKFQPVAILKDKLKLGGTNYFTRTLLGAQFTISLIAIVCSLAYVRNARYQEQYDLGFDIRGSIISWLDGEQEFSQYRNALEQNPDVISTAGARSGIFSNRKQSPVKFESQEAEVDLIEVGDNYLKTMGLDLLLGRDFIKDSRSDENESIIITENMAVLFGWKQPIGKEVILGDSVKLIVVGVVKNVYTQGLWREMDPMMIRYILPEKYDQIVVSADPEDVAAVNADMKNKWSSLFPSRLYNGKMLITGIHEVTDLNKSIMQVYAFLALIATLLSATGLYTLVSLNIIRRMKEIGVRKVLGASVYHIYRIINMEFLIILIIAFVLGSWASYNLTQVVMSSIWKYYQSANGFSITIGVASMLVVCVLTIGFKVFSVATMNPVKTLRNE